MITYKETSVLELESPLFKQCGIQVLVKRENQNHPNISGNKWWKLKYNLAEAIRLEKKTILTFGGAFSNHIYATAAAASELNLRSIGIIRGEETWPLNSTLSFADRMGMDLCYISRERYRRKSEPDFSDQLKAKFDDFYLIPEGGTNEFAVRGCKEFGEKLIKEIDFDYVCLPAGTGGTLAGIVEGLAGEKKVIGFCVLKEGAFLDDEIKRYTQFKNWEVNLDYHVGGYAKTTAELINFSNDFKRDFDILLDSVYTSKMFFGAIDLIRKGFFRRGSTVLLVHTGGLQAENHDGANDFF